MLLPRTQVRFPGPTWWLIPVCNSSSKGWIPPSNLQRHQAHTRCTRMHALNTHTHTHKSKQNKKPLIIREEAHTLSSLFLIVLEARSHFVTLKSASNQDPLPPTFWDYRHASPRPALQPQFPVPVHIQMSSLRTSRTGRCFPQANHIN